MKLQTKYNYVIFGSDWDLYKLSYSELYDYDNIVYISSPKDSLGIFSVFQKIHFSGRLNRIVRIPFKGMWNGFYFKDEFTEKKPICFIFFWGWIANNLETHFSSYLKTHYPNSKTVLFLQDVVSSHFQNNIQTLIKEFDMVVSYDKSDCETYGFHYHPTVFSKVNIPFDNKLKDSDFYFIGQDKGRLNTLIALYNSLTSSGFTCDFIIQGEIPFGTTLPNGMKHIKTSIPYIENLKHSARTKCIVEIMQPNAKGYTFRTWEAIAYDKFLLSNNSSLINAPFYNSNDFCIMEEGNGLNAQFLDNVKFNSYKGNKYKNEIKPQSLILFIDDNLL